MGLQGMKGPSTYLLCPRGQMQVTPQRAHLGAHPYNLYRKETPAFLSPSPSYFLTLGFILLFLPQSKQAHRSVSNGLGEAAMINTSSSGWNLSRPGSLGRGCRLWGAHRVV